MNNNEKIIDKFCEEFFKFITIKQNKKLSETDKKRIGFYHLVLQYLTGESEIDTINEMIQDTEFRSIVFNEKVNDFGIDAVYIDNVNCNIQLFCFKYYEGKKVNGKLDGEILDKARKFLDLVYSDDSAVDKETDIVHKHINAIQHVLNDNLYKLELFCISNTRSGFDNRENENLKTFEDKYGITVNSISQNEIISGLGPIKRNKVNCKFIIKNSDYFRSEPILVCKVSLYDIVRITSKDNIDRESFDNKKIEIAKVKFEASSINDNVRGYLNKSKYIKNMINTVKNEWKNFFVFNNGITIACNNIELNKKTYGNKTIIILGDYQIVNGGQTIRNVYEYIKLNDNDYEIKLKNSFVLVRIVDTKGLSIEKIAEYTNTQNPISKINLKANDSIQIQIEKYLYSKGILYVRKAGEVIDIKKHKQYNKRITMEKFTQILYASQGFPERVSNQKIRLFDDYYEDIYDNTRFDIEKCESLIEVYDSIKEEYHKKSKNKYAEQKVFYIIYMLHFFTDLTIQESISILEKAIKNSKKTKRPMLQPDFKDDLRKLIERE